MGVASRAFVAACLGALLVSVPNVSAGIEALPRSTTDRPDTATGPQIHALYVIPSDGVDRAFDTDGTVSASVTNWQRWLLSQTTDSQLRLDLSGAELDISFVRLSQTDAALAARGAFIRDAIEQELRAVGFNRSDKVYAVYYDGTATAACASAAWPPSIPGNVGAVYMRATYGGGLSCYDPALSRSGLQVMDFAMLHEVLHAMGFAPSCAPHHNGSGHVSDDPRDIMYAGSEPWRPSILDVGNDDYYKARIAGCSDLTDSQYLERATSPPTGPPPPKASKVALTVKVVGPGRVTSSPAGVSCKPRCKMSVDKGTVVTLTAVPTRGARFVRWTGSCTGKGKCRAAMSRARSVTAQFRR